MKQGNRKKLGLITEEQETAELVKEMNNGGSGYIDPAVNPEYYTDPIRYAQDPILNTGGGGSAYVSDAVVLDPAPDNGGGSAPINNGTITQDQPAPIDNSGDLVPVEPRPAVRSGLNWPLLLGVAVVFYLITKKS